MKAGANPIDVTSFTDRTGNRAANVDLAQRRAKLQYDDGCAPSSTVLQAEQSLFPAELTLAAERASVFTSAANTYKAMGGGWVTEADKLTGNVGRSTDERVTQQPVF